MSFGETLIVMGILFGVGIVIQRYLDKCKHTWDLDKHVIVPSRLQQMKELGINPTSWNGFDLVEKHVIVYKCASCGELKVVKEES